MPRLPLAFACLSLAACRAARPSELPRDEAWIVAVQSVRIPDWMQWYTQFAHHTWIDAKRGSDDAWVRLEVEGEHTGGTLEALAPSEARAHRRWGRDVELHGFVVGAEAHRIAQRLDEAVAKFGPQYAATYRGWPGPNSNTFVRDVAREIGGPSFVFDHNAVGKDWHGFFGAGWTPSRTGVHVDVPGLGFALAAREGLELHLLGLVLGLQLSPLRLELPVLPELPWSRGSSDAARESTPAPRAKNTFTLGGA